MAGGAKSKATIVLASVAIILGGWLLVRSVFSGPDVGSVDYLQTDLTVKDSETGEEWEMSRGKLEQELYSRSGDIDPNEGLPNPTTGKPTGFPMNRERDWDAVVERIIAEKARLREKRGK